MQPSEPESTERFTDRAGDYARFRPSYPAAAIDAVLDGLGDPNALAAADVGAGTGISSRLLADRGVDVVAIEPNAAMRAAATPHERVRWQEGTAVATGLAGASVDVVLVAQAFHWFDVPTTLREFQRVLRPRGRLAILWNRRRRDHSFTAGYREALEAIDADAPVERSTFDPAVVGATGRFAGMRALEFENAHPLTLEQLIGRARSTSTVPKSGPRLETLLRSLTELHRRHADASGCATMVYRTEVFLWQRADSRTGRAAAPS